MCMSLAFSTIADSYKSPGLEWILTEDRHIHTRKHLFLLTGYESALRRSAKRLYSRRTYRGHPQLSWLIWNRQGKGTNCSDLGLPSEPVHGVFHVSVQPPWRNGMVGGRAGRVDLESGSLWHLRRKRKRMHAHPSILCRPPNDPSANRHSWQ